MKKKKNISHWHHTCYRVPYKFDNIFTKIISSSGWCRDRNSCCGTDVTSLIAWQSALISSHHPITLAPLALLSDLPQGTQSLLVWNNVKNNNNKRERGRKKERLGFICKFLRIAIMVSCWNTHKLTSDLTDHWAFLQHYTYWCLENTLYIQKRQKLLKRWKLNIHTGVGHLSKTVFPRTADINKKGFGTGTLPLTGKTSCLSNGEILFK